MQERDGGPIGVDMVAGLDHAEQLHPAEAQEVLEARRLMWLELERVCTVAPLEHLIAVALEDAGGDFAHGFIVLDEARWTPRRSRRIA